MRVVSTELVELQNEHSATRQKPQSNGLWGEDIIQLMYDVPNNHIQVWKFEGKTWMQQGKDIPLKFADGDVFSVFAGKDGTVEIRRNGKLLTTRQLLDVLIPIPTPTVTETPEKKDASVPELVNYLPASFRFSIVPAPQQQSGSVTIDYVYDPLYRLTEANYSTGDYYQYTYDAVGNRLTETTQLAVTSYQYDVVNRLASVDSVTYTWDNNGNLLNDGVNTYDYDSANRLISISGGQTATYAYNGLGDRLSQNGVNYTLDLNAGLTQVLNDGTNQYLYGVGRIAQVNTSTLVTDYFMTDALGSVRQLTDSQGDVTLANAYEPYGTLAQTAGSAQTSYGFTGEQQDPSGMVYLRARYYSSDAGRFLTRDTWMGDYNNPLSLNRWMYVEGNPINYSDPSGHCVNPDGSVTWWKWPWFNWGPCPTDANGTSVSPSPTLVAILTATATCTPTPTATGTPMPIGTPTSILDLDQYFASLPEPYAQLPSKMRVSNAGINFLKKWEYFYGSLYNDANNPKDKYFFDTNGRGKGNCTIGYGYKVHDLPCNQYPTEDRFKNGISEPRAEELLREQAYIKAEVWIRSYVTVKLTQTQYDALVSLYYNWGGDKLIDPEHPDKLALLNSGQYVATANHIRLGPVTSGGVYFDSLQRRRNEEADMFLLPVNFSGP
jgi:RHS repeat-associated protein